MPNNFFSVDSRFPNIANKTQEQINGEVINYLFLLLEQLRYTMGNLGVGNFNEAELDGIAGMISDPIYMRLEDAEGNVNAVQITAEGLTEQLTNVRGDVNTLQITANGLTESIKDAENNIALVNLKADGIIFRVEGENGSISQLTQRSNEIAAAVGQTNIRIDGLGVEIDGKVSFMHLQIPGATVIDAGNITTGTLNAINITNSNFTSYDAAGRAFLIGYGAFTIYSGSSMIGGMYINDANEMLVLHATRGLTLDSAVNITYESAIKGNLILHMGNIAQNAASIRALLGI